MFINENDEEMRSAIVQQLNGQKMELPISKLAYGKPGQNFQYGARVIAFRRCVDLPYTIDAQTNAIVPLYPNQYHDSWSMNHIQECWQFLVKIVICM